VAPSSGSVDSEAQAKRSAQRLVRVAGGIDGLEIFLQDLVRDGLGNLAEGGYARFEDQARRLVDAQAPGLARRVRGLAGLIGQGESWPANLLSAMGKLALLVEAFYSLDTLSEPLQADVRNAIGWPRRREHVLAHGDVTQDLWQVIGQWEDTRDERIRTLRTWLLGAESERLALVLNHAPGERPFQDALPNTGVLQATLAFWPSAVPQRALVLARSPAETACKGSGGHTTLAEMADAYANSQSRCPFGVLELVRLAQVRPGQIGKAPALIDHTGHGIPLRTRLPSRLLAVSGGHPVDVTGEWDGRRLRPLGVWDGFHWTALGELS
jgi:hypothetical protein